LGFSSWKCYVKVKFRDDFGVDSSFTYVVWGSSDVAICDAIVSRKWKKNFNQNQIANECVVIIYKSRKKKEMHKYHGKVNLKIKVKNECLSKIC
jgi:3-isopropylmalate dehydratase small subunit